jgi:hypothetical protein
MCRRSSPASRSRGLGGRRQGQAGEHAQRALGQQPPRGQQPGSLTRQPQHLVSGGGPVARHMNGMISSVRE